MFLSSSSKLGEQPQAAQGACAMAAGRTFSGGSGGSALISPLHSFWKCSARGCFMRNMHLRQSPDHTPSCCQPLQPASRLLHPSAAPCILCSKHDTMGMRTGDRRAALQTRGSKARMHAKLAEWPPSQLQSCQACTLLRPTRQRTSPKAAPCCRACNRAHPVSRAWRMRDDHTASFCRAPAWPRISRELRARVRPTLMRRSSATKPMPPLRRVRTALRDHQRPSPCPAAHAPGGAVGYGDAVLHPACIIMPYTHCMRSSVVWVCAQKYAH